ncbi:MAG: hydroxyacid dehydrogenase [Planctomycetes bacterium]|nr:hydroxyacid dehydrogenase [Planctomycetota bacterium]
MKNAIAVHESFDAVWPFAADHFCRLWEKQGPVEFVRLDDKACPPLSKAISRPPEVVRLVSMGVPFTNECLAVFSGLKEAVIDPLSPEIEAQLCRKGVRIYHHVREGFWGQSCAEFALALTLCGLRRIPQLHRAIITDPSPWDYSPPSGRGCPGCRGFQYGDDGRFANGTLEGKRVRIVGAGNIATRYASFAHFMGADVAAWSPRSAEPCFHRAGARREWHIERLVRDAEIFAPMLPLRDSTRGLVHAALIDALPRGCLVVLVTRAEICDTAALRRRVLADELALAADVFDVEPLPLGDPLLGRSNVIHTPHNAGRTRRSNEQWAEELAEQFLPA